jgi:putative toxin-antitoxin system antitoxin component (TIGR02293 family)
MLAPKTYRSNRKRRRVLRRVARRIPGTHARDTLTIVRQIQAGFPFARLDRFARNSGLSWERVTRLVAIPERTLSRRRTSGRLTAEESDRLFRATHVFDQAVELFEGDVTAAREWLQKAQPGLGGAVPLEIASTDVGAREVEHLIGRLEHGVFP